VYPPFSQGAQDPADVGQDNVTRAQRERRRRMRQVAAASANGFDRTSTSPRPLTCPGALGFCVLISAFCVGQFPVSPELPQGSAPFGVPGGMTPVFMTMGRLLP